MFQSAMSQQTGNGFDISAIARLPIKDNKPSFKGITTPLLAECPLVLLCSNFNNRLE
jgi:hypothetical protein